MGSLEYLFLLSFRANIGTPWSPVNHRAPVSIHSHLWAIVESPVNLMSMFVDSGKKLEDLEGSKARTGGKCKLHTRRPSMYNLRF